ncbi:MAG: HAD-IA family hydrolase [Clostridia bacterium]|nr:HAD-IA family hydrolase [Clostridia bacterium]
MIKHVIFDFGQVMVRFDPAYMVGRYVSDVADATLLETVVFDRLYWDRLDAGIITDEETLAACRARLPERLWAVAAEIYYNWIYHIPEIEGMGEIVADLRARGVRVILLSNISKYFASHAAEIPSLSLFERCFFSAVCGKCKPDTSFFADVCAESGMDPAETLFVDDNAGNLAGAAACGITGYLFDGDALRLRAYLEALQLL